MKSIQQLENEIRILRIQEAQLNSELRLRLQQTTYISIVQTHVREISKQDYERMFVVYGG